MSTLSPALLEEVTRLYMQASTTLDPVRLQAWEEFGLTLAQLRILFSIRSNPGLDVRGLAERLRITPSAASQQVDKLVLRGLLTRTDNPRDRRRVILEVTQDAQSIMAELSRASRDHVEALLSRLTEEELQQLGMLLRRILGKDLWVPPGS